MISNIAGHIPASVFSVKETRASLHFEKDDNHGAGFFLYLCVGISVLAAFLFGLPGLGASCWCVAAGSAGHPECLPYKDAMCVWLVKCLKGDPSFWSWDFGFSDVRCREQSGIVGRNGHHGDITAQLIELPVYQLHEYVRIFFESGTEGPVRVL